MCRQRDLAQEEHTWGQPVWMCSTSYCSRICATVVNLFILPSSSTPTMCALRTKHTSMPRGPHMGIFCWTWEASKTAICIWGRTSFLESGRSSTCHSECMRMEKRNISRCNIRITRAHDRRKHESSPAAVHPDTEEDNAHERGEMTRFPERLWLWQLTASASAPKMT